MTGQAKPLWKGEYSFDDPSMPLFYRDFGGNDYCIKHKKNDRDCLVSLCQCWNCKSDGYHWPTVNTWNKDNDNKLIKNYVLNKNQIDKCEKLS